MKKKRGQFFITSAIIIIVVLISIVTVSNYTQKTDVIKLYDLGEELGIESQNVLDYGTYSGMDEAEIKTLMENFIESYVSYMGEGKNIYFVFGNKDKIYVIGYQDLDKTESVCVTLNPKPQSSECIGLHAIGETQSFTTTGEINKVAILIGTNQYEFGLRKGENFYFVIWEKVGDEKQVVTSEDVHR